MGSPEHEIDRSSRSSAIRFQPGNPLKMEVSWRFERPSLILSLRPHMHRRGKHWRYWLKYPDGSEATLLALPDGDMIGNLAAPSKLRSRFPPARRFSPPRAMTTPLTILIILIPTWT